GGDVELGPVAGGEDGTTGDSRPFRQPAQPVPQRLPRDVDPLADLERGGAVVYALDQKLHWFESNYGEPSGWRPDRQARSEPGLGGRRPASPPPSPSGDRPAPGSVRSPRTGEPPPAPAG